MTSKKTEQHPISELHISDADKEVLRAVAHKAAVEAVDEQCEALGMDVSNKLEVQKDFASLRELRKLFESPAMQQDLMTIRNWRLSMEALSQKGITSILGIFIIGILALIVMGVKTWVVSQ